MEIDLKKKLRVLIVENNPVDRKVIEGMLLQTAYGSFEIESCDSLEEAFKLLSELPFDVVLLDLNLKDASGLDTLKEVNAFNPSMPIVVNTGAYQDDLGLLAVTRGAQDYLIKGKYKPYVLSKSLYYAVERKKAEEELKQAYLSLKDAQTQLIQAEKMNVVGSIASGIAHEVKNPLATIVYGIEYLYNKCDLGDEKIALTLRSIKQAANKANSIIQDLLDFASISNLKKEPCDLDQVIEHALNLTHHQCEKIGIKIVKAFAPELPWVAIDKNRIEQVLVDVMLNSIHAMKEGGQMTLKTAFLKQIKLSREILEEHTSLNAQMISGVVIDIDDTGGGIDPEDLPYIFDPFFTTRRGSGGVGLGLSIAKTIIKSHGAIITISNIEGGARARIIFPADHK